MAFIEIWFPPNSLPDGRQGLEDHLDDTLQNRGLGEVTGGGTGTLGSNIDIEVTDVDAAVPVIRRVLVLEGVHPDTAIRQREPNVVVYRVYE